MSTSRMHESHVWRWVWRKVHFSCTCHESMTTKRQPALFDSASPLPLRHSYHHTTLTGFVPVLNHGQPYFNWRCQNCALSIQVPEIGRDFDESHFFVTNGVSGVKILVWWCEWLIECLQHTVGHSFSPIYWIFAFFTHLDRDFIRCLLLEKPWTHGMMALSCVFDTDAWNIANPCCVRCHVYIKGIIRIFTQQASLWCVHFFYLELKARVGTLPHPWK